jgi:hypothetical protein
MPALDRRGCKNQCLTNLARCVSRTAEEARDAQSHINPQTVGFAAGLCTSSTHAAPWNGSRLHDSREQYVAGLSAKSTCGHCFCSVKHNIPNSNENTLRYRLGLFKRPPESALRRFQLYQIAAQVCTRTPSNVAELFADSRAVCTSVPIIPSHLAFASTMDCVVAARDGLFLGPGRALFIELKTHSASSHSST